MFQLTSREWENMRSQFVTTSVIKRNKQALPYAFTEHGVTMLASVLKSTKARQMNIAIVRTFISLRKLLHTNTTIIDQLKEIRERIAEHDVQLNQIYDAIENLLDEKTEQKNWDQRQRIGFILNP